MHSHSQTRDLARRSEMQTQKETWEQQQQQQHSHGTKLSSQLFRGSPRKKEEEEEEEGTTSRSAIDVFRAKEEEIERKKMEVREKVFSQLGRVEQETKRLAEIRGELEAMSDPMRKEAAAVRKKIDTITRELKPLGQSCLKKEKEYKEAMEALNEKNKEKTQLVNRLVELISESEKLRMKRLDELNRTLDSFHYNPTS